MLFLDETLFVNPICHGAWHEFKYHIPMKIGRERFIWVSFSENVH